MGEIVVGNEGLMDLAQTDAHTVVDGGSAAVVRWEKFLPRMSLRVLLVEADDSTRQIIAALLRKCSYKVAAVSDGLKAWEVLKGRPQQIDLILTEVELPSISGYALLTLIAEHEICKNIPIIMMSSLDSVSTVYKCMLRGAADFLVKPLRKNELKNLWQHVWRRQTSASVGGNGVREESDAQQKVEATAENNATSNHSSGYMACLKRNRECIEKGSDAQSSCTKMSRPDLEADGEYMEHVQDLSPAKRSKSLSADRINTQSQQHKESVNARKQLLVTDNGDGGSVPLTNNANMLTSREDTLPQAQCERTIFDTEVHDNDQAPANAYTEAIDLIGTLNNHPKFTYQHDGANKVDSSPLLDLSLRRSHISGPVNQVMDENHRLKHSGASAFSRYINRTSQPPNSTSASISNQQNNFETCSDKQVSNHSDNQGPTKNPLSNMITNGNDQLGQGELHFPSPHRRVFPVPVPVEGFRFNSLPNTSYGSLFPQMFCSQLGLSPVPSPGSSSPQGPAFQLNPFGPSSNHETRSSLKNCNLMDQNAKTEQTEQLQGHLSPATDQSATSSFCTGNINMIVRASVEGGNDGTTHVQDENSHRSTLREAALNKFRMKRKDRCYDKKVRYESRKKLAEQRPRVKGQFVRQINSEPPPVETGNFDLFRLTI